MNLFQIGMGWPLDQPGGLNRYYSDLIAILSEQDFFPNLYTTGFVTTNDHRADVHRNVQSFAKAKSPLPLRWLRLWKALRAESARNKADLVVNHFAPYGIIGSQFAKHANIPEVTHFHGPWAAESEIENENPLKHFSKKLIEDLAYRRSRRYIVLSSAFAKVLSGDYSVSPDLIDIIPPGIDTDRFNISNTKTEARKKLGWPNDTFTIVSVRRLMKRMGLDLAIQAIHSLKTSVPNVQYFIGGIGPEESSLRKLIEDLKLNENVHLLGRIHDDQLALHYQSADVSLVPTRDWEGFGLVVAESLACGTPCIVSNTGGLPEVVSELRHELILPELTPDSIVKKLLEFKSTQFGLDSECIRKFVLKRFTWKINAKKIVNCYSQAVENR